MNDTADTLTAITVNYLVTTIPKLMQKGHRSGFNSVLYVSNLPQMRGLHDWSMYSEIKQFLS